MTWHARHAKTKTMKRGEAASDRAYSHQMSAGMMNASRTPPPVFQRQSQPAESVPFKVSIKHIDYYVTKALPHLDICYSPFTGQQVDDAPIIRIFGTTPAGQSVCLHIHKILPYLYVPYEQSLKDEYGTRPEFFRRLAHCIDDAIISSRGTVSGHSDPGQALRRKCVHLCTFVRAKSFYGFHERDTLFVKIYLYNPQDLGRVANLLLSGSVMGRKFQPYEAHIPYLLKFKTDHNLHGMEYVELSRVTMREPFPSYAGSPNTKRGRFVSQNVSITDCSASDRDAEYPVWHEMNMPRAWISRGDVVHSHKLHRDAVCDLEADAFCEDILNPGKGVKEDLERADDDLKMVPSLAPIWAEQKRRSKEMGMPFPPKQPPPPQRNSSTWVDVLKGNLSEVLSRQLKGFAKESASHVEGDNARDRLLNTTQPANDPPSLQRLHASIAEEREHAQTVGRREKSDVSHRATQSQNTQDIDKAMLETLRWMQNDGNGVGDKNQPSSLSHAEAHSQDHDGGIDEGIRAYHDNHTSQRECEDIINCSLENIDIEPDRVSMSHSDSSIPEFESTEMDAESDDIEVIKASDDRRAHGSLDAEKRFEHSNPLQGVFVKILKPMSLPPSRDEVSDSLSAHGIHNVVYQGPFFSNPSDVPKRKVFFAGQQFRLTSTLPQEVKGFSSEGPSGSAFFDEKRKLRALKGATPLATLRVLSSTKLPISHDEAVSWLASAKDEPKHKRMRNDVDTLQLDANTGAFIPMGNNQEGAQMGTPLCPSGSFVTSPADTEEFSLGRPASPKYDEQVPLHSSFGFGFNTIPIDQITRVGGPRELKTGKASDRRPDENANAVGKSKREFEVAKGTKGKGISQITPPSPLKASDDRTPSSQLGFKFQPLKSSCSSVPLPTILSIEVFAESRDKLLPNPKFDAVRAVALVYQTQTLKSQAEEDRPNLVLLYYDELDGQSMTSQLLGKYGLSKSSELLICVDEKSLLSKCVSKILEADPDIIVGFEVQSTSVGYLKDRMQVHNREESFLRMISRSPGIPSNLERMEDEYGQLHASGMHSAGRIILNLWRCLRSELKLTIYTFHTCVYALLRIRAPQFPHADLTSWFTARETRWRVMEHIVQRSVLNVQMMDCLDLVNRTSELARVYGIDFYSALTRGSQYRVESLLVRLAHSQNYLMVSPSKAQVANQPAMACLPLVMEPESRFYTSPVLVLDFQSLYPSMVIAYNLCYSTLLGSLSVSRKPSQLGALGSFCPEALLEDRIAIENLIYAPNRMLFASSKERKGIMPRMLKEILETRQMLKQVMKGLDSSQRALHRLLNARQFALKLLANVSYGYTAAGFSGRMPCAELADSIVQFGRRTMEEAIKLVEANDRWQAKVVYGDTDSLFVHLPGRTREEAFAIGDEIAAQVTLSNPDPVTLKFEKVYHPCVLLTKKRYVGYAYESRQQRKPTFDAKGIETIRRDSCPAVSKILERSLRTLFESKDLSRVKAYLTKQWEKILRNRVNIHDFVFAKEVRLGTYSTNAAVMPPAAIVAAKAMALDPRSEPKYAERIPYVVVHGEPGARLVDMVVSPQTLVECAKGLRLHGQYYITKQILPALERCFSLIGADVRLWFLHMPKPMRCQPTKRSLRGIGVVTQHTLVSGDAHTIDHFYMSRHCAVCDALVVANQPICEDCVMRPQQTFLALNARTAHLEKSLLRTEVICKHCGGQDSGGARIACTSIDCGVYFLRAKLQEETNASITLSRVSGAFLQM